tara:strand:+ start:2146 stop:2370 length:225 start_codon:yes stop_codon:yes gene_type:complete
VVEVAVDVLKVVVVDLDVLTIVEVLVEVLYVVVVDLLVAQVVVVLFVVEVAFVVPVIQKSFLKKPNHFAIFHNF